MKPIAILDFTKQNKKKLVNYLNERNGGNCLIIYQHGLGDLIEFLPVFNTLIKKYPNWNFNIGFHPSLQLDMMHEKAISITDLNKNFTLPIGKSYVQVPQVFDVFNMDKLLSRYDVVAAIQMWDYRHPFNKTPNPNATFKHIMASILEVGLPEGTVFEKYIPPFKKDLNNKDSKRVIFHVGGHTDKQIKNPSPEAQECIWNEIKEAGYEPFDVHMNSSSSIVGTKLETPPYIKDGEHIRNSEGGLKTLISEVLKAKYIVGVVSGPLHLCNVLYGSENCLGLEGMFPVNNYVYSETGLDTVKIHPYDPGSVYEWLKKKDL